MAATSALSNTQTLKLLLNHPKIDVNTADYYGDTALIKASSWGSVEVVRALLQCPLVDIDIKGWDNKTIVDAAKENGRENIVDMIEHRSELLKKENSTCPHAKYSVGRNDALIVAVPHDCDNDFVNFMTFEGQLDELERILLQCPELDSRVINSRPIYGQTALIRAVDESKPKLVKMLLDQPNIDPNKEGGIDDGPPLLSAIVYENTELVQLLLDDPRCGMLSSCTNDQRLIDPVLG